MQTERQNSKGCLLEALAGVRNKRTPVWFMRQAGRYLPEYRKLREQHKLITLMTEAELAAEVTLQPLQRFDLDAAIIFADILTPLISLGVKLDFAEGVGPVLDLPYGLPALIERKEAVQGPKADFTCKTIKIVAAELANKNIPLIGFCGAPFTVAAYLIEAGQPSKRELKLTKAMLRSNPEQWHQLMSVLSLHFADYLVEQVQSGADALQIFDSWVGALAPDEFISSVYPYILRIIKSVQSRVDAPIIYFGLNNAGHLPYLSGLGCAAFGIDWCIDLSSAQTLLGQPAVLQGNLDPSLLTPGNEPALSQAVQNIAIQAKKLPAHIFNVGHGLTPQSSLGSIERCIELLRNNETI